MVICLTLLLAPATLAASEVERDSLKGLPGVQVLVETLPADVEQYGLTAELIRTDVELRLRRSGIRVFSADEEDPSPAKAFVYVNLNVFQVDNGAPGLYAASVSVELHQRLRSLVSGLAFYGTTWERSSVHTLGKNNLRQLRDDVNDVVDKFINDYLAANPRRQ
jgi:hypothetical protein